MKLLTLVLFFSPLLASAEMNSGTVVCQGANGSQTVSITIGIAPAGNSATFHYLDSKNPAQPWDFTADPRDIGPSTIAFQSVNFTLGHHNTVIKVLGDGDIFGGDSDTATEQTPYKGILFLQDGNGDSTKTKFVVSCKKTI